MTVRETSVFSYPRGDVMTSLRTLVDQLNRKQREAGDVTAESLAALQTDLEGQIDAAETLLEALESNVTALDAQVTTNAGQITDIFAQLDVLEGSGVTAQQAFVIGLVTTVDTVLGSVSNQVLQLKKQSEALAQAAITEIVRGREDGAAIKVEQAVRQTETLSLASQITSLTADLNTTNASIVSEQTARAGADTTLQNNINTANSLRADGDAALASDITTLTTTVNGNTSQITILAASIDGVEGRFGVAINLNGDVVGLVQLDGTPSGSTFTVVADKFIVAQRDLSGGDPVPVFGLSVVGGSAKLALRGDMIADGTIIARTVAANAITADKIAANSITSDKITAGAITADKIAAGAVVTSRLNSPDFRLDINAGAATPYIRLTS